MTEHNFTPPNLAPDWRTLPTPDLEQLAGVMAAAETHARLLGRGQAELKAADQGRLVRAELRGRRKDGDRKPGTPQPVKARDFQATLLALRNSMQMFEEGLLAALRARIAIGQAEFTVQTAPLDAGHETETQPGESPERKAV